MTETIRTAHERAVRALTLRPGVGRGTAITKARMREGFTCEIEDGRWRLTADLSEKSGGTASGPDPGVFGRAALASCLAISYTRWADWMGIPIEDLTVEVQADYDLRGEYGFSGFSPEYTEVRYVVCVTSSATEDELNELLVKAEERTPWLQMLLNDLPLRREIKLTQTVL